MCCCFFMTDDFTIDGFSETLPWPCLQLPFKDHWGLPRTKFSVTVLALFVLGGLVPFDHGNVHFMITTAHGW